MNKPIDYRPALWTAIVLTLGPVVAASFSVTLLRASWGSALAEVYFFSAATVASALAVTAFVFAGFHGVEWSFKTACRGTRWLAERVRASRAARKAE